MTNRPGDRWNLEPAAKADQLLAADSWSPVVPGFGGYRLTDGQGPAVYSRSRGFSGARTIDRF